MNAKDLISSLNWRYAVKQFNSTKKISKEDWEVLESTLLLSPSSYGLQPWKFLIVETPSIREELKPVSWNQSQVTDASHFVVFLSRDNLTENHVKEFIQDVAKTRGQNPEDLKGYEDMMVANVVHGKKGEELLNWTRRQSYIAMGFLLEAAALLKIDTTPMEGIDTAAYDRILKLEGSGWKSVAAVALGYRHEEDQYQFAKKTRFPKEKIISRI